MGLLSRHIDETSLRRWQSGLLSTGASVRLLEHAGRCEACGERYRRAALAQRALEQKPFDEPSAAELETIAAVALPAALRAAALTPARSRAPWLGAIALAAAAASIALLVRPAPSEFTARGVDPRGAAVLRVFCASDGLREMKEVASCPRGASLAFAAGARPPLTTVALSLRSGTTQIALGAHPVSGALDREAPLDTTPVLDVPAGPAEVVASFASSPEAAQAGLADPARPEVVVVRQAFRVGTSP